MHTRVIRFWLSRLGFTSRCAIRLVIGTLGEISRPQSLLLDYAPIWWWPSRKVLHVCIVGGNIMKPCRRHCIMLTWTSLLDRDTILIVTRCRCYSGESSINKYPTIESRLWRKKMLDFHVRLFYDYSISHTPLRSFVPQHYRFYSILIGNRAPISWKVCVYD